MTDLISKIEEILEEGTAAITAATNLEGLDAARVRVLGRKAPLAGLNQSMGALKPDERREVGKALNQARARLESLFEERSADLAAKAEAAQLARDGLDLTLPGRGRPAGHPHPLRLIEQRVVDAFVGMGYRVADGPEVEDDWHNFQALNMPPDHPARSMQDTLYLEGLELLLRTHTSPVQIREMQRCEPPLAIVVPGRVYRRDPFDATHSPAFHQIEGLLIDRGVNFAHLRGTLDAFVREVFGPTQKVRLRPSYFPFTEPSAEVDVLCVRCDGEGCPTCGRTGWLEIMGAGMVHPSVLSAAGHDPDAVSGFAFGLGIERIAMLVYEVHDIRSLYDGDQRFLAGFHA
ncbi:MAG: phenylalanine--tRNA ligase subunit alpha [Actinomycetota bacterium]